LTMHCVNIPTLSPFIIVLFGKLLANTYASLESHFFKYIVSSILAFVKECAFVPLTSQRHVE
jgi:hypothetical protein